MNKNLIGYTALRKGYFKYQEKKKNIFFYFLIHLYWIVNIEKVNLEKL